MMYQDYFGDKYPGEIRQNINLDLKVTNAGQLQTSPMAIVLFSHLTFKWYYMFKKTNS